MTQTRDNGPSASGHWMACFCCGMSFDGANMVTFGQHPEQGVCVGCAAWLYTRSRPIVRRIYGQSWLQLRRKRDAKAADRLD